jgi:uncharacterized repeat protein (TIGR03847 family)
MKRPETIELREPYFVTIDTIGPPGQRTFYLQAAQDDLLVTLIIEKEQASALAIAISGLLDQLESARYEPDIDDMDLIEPVLPLFRVGNLQLGYEETQGRIVIIADRLAPDEAEDTVENETMQVLIWGDHRQMEALARKAAVVVAAGRPRCPLCDEVLTPGEQHVCVRGNGRKHHN